MAESSKAYYKEIGSELVTPSQCEAKNREAEKNYPVFCVGCHSQLISHGVGSPNVTERFRHYPNNENNCIFQSRQRYGFLNNVSIDCEMGKIVRNAFFTKDHLIKAYALCLSMKGRGTLTQQEFIRIVEMADAIGIWNYKNIELWSVTMILLLKINFSFKKTGTNYYYKFKRIGHRQNYSENEQWNGLVLQPCFLESHAEVGQKYNKPAIPFSEDWYQDVINKLTWIKEDYCKMIMSLFLKKMILSSIPIKRVS